MVTAINNIAHYGNKCVLRVGFIATLLKSIEVRYNCKDMKMRMLSLPLTFLFNSHSWKVSSITYFDLVAGILAEDCIVSNEVNYRMNMIRTWYFFL